MMDNYGFCYDQISDTVHSKKSGREIHGAAKDLCIMVYERGPLSYVSKYIQVVENCNQTYKEQIGFLNEKISLTESRIKNLEEELEAINAGLLHKALLIKLLSLRVLVKKETGCSGSKHRELYSLEILI